MSHIVTVRTEVRDQAAVEAACRRLSLPPPVLGEFETYSQRLAGLGVQLPGWRYPVVCDLERGVVVFDDYGGRWGDRRELDGFLQAYAVERTTLEARRKGYSVAEEALADGSIRLQILVGETTA
jgi:hypothetical protein